MYSKLLKIIVEIFKRRKNEIIFIYMSDIERGLRKERKIVHERRKILRIKPVIWMCRYWYLVVVILSLIITTLLGVYDIDNINFVNIDGENVKEREVRELVEEYMGENFFMVNPKEVEGDVLKNSYVRSVKVEKIFPNKLKIKVEEYLPFIVFENESKCKIFSLEGRLLEIQEEIDCESFSQERKLIYFIGATTLVVVENGRETFYLTDNIGKVSKILEQFNIEITSVDMDDNILNISTNSGLIIMDINQDNDVELARLFLVLEELDSQGIESSSIDVRFKRPVIQIDK